MINKRRKYLLEVYDWEIEDILRESKEHSWLLAMEEGGEDYCRACCVSREYFGDEELRKDFEKFLEEHNAKEMN